MKVVRAALAAGLGFAIGCKSAPAPAPPPAATVEHPVKEAELTKVTLSPEAEGRLGLTTAPVESRSLPDTRVLGGVVMTPPGKSFPLTAPVAGTVLAPAGGMPRPGERVSRGQALLRLVPLPPDPLRVDEDVALAEARARQAELEAARIEELARDSLVSRRELEQGARLRPGQRVDVSIPLRGRSAAPRLAVPLGALVYDLNGGTWVYVKAGEHVYVRHRVALDGIVGQWAVLARGPEPGTQVVTTGAAELFGTEFGAGK